MTLQPTSYEDTLLREMRDGDDEAADERAARRREEMAEWREERARERDEEFQQPTNL